MVVKQEKETLNFKSRPGSVILKGFNFCVNFTVHARTVTRSVNFADPGPGLQMCLFKIDHKNAIVMSIDYRQTKNKRLLWVTLYRHIYRAWIYFSGQRLGRLRLIS